jgi:hypothetical protein
MGAPRCHRAGPFFAGRSSDDRPAPRACPIAAGSRNLRNKSENVQLPNPQKDTDFTFPSGRNDNDATA